GGGKGYYLLNYVLDDQKSEKGLSAMTYELLSQTSERVELSLTLDDPRKLPFVVEYHFVLEADAPGIYVYSIFKYSDEMPEHMDIEQSRYSRSEEHTSELQSRFDLVCRVLLEKK